MTWRPSLGASPEEGGTRFRVWAPRARAVEVVVESRGESRPGIPLSSAAGGIFTGAIADLDARARYRYRLDGQGPWPDPASRSQPDGVHGASEIVDPRTFPWTDAGWTGRGLDEVILYELHIGTFTAAGTFAAARERLEYLRDLGVTAIEIMPVAAFPGCCNWGYDGAALFAPASGYGTPDDMRSFVDHAHHLGLAVHLDLVFNHLGPDGAYLAAIAPTVFSTVHRSPWGAGINLDGEGSDGVRAFFIECALHWIHEYHIDGLRLDATHALVDEGPYHFLAELAARVRESVSGREVLLIAEDARNLAGMVRAEAEGGWAMDAVWADDFHHQMRRILAGDDEGYFADFSDRVEDLATTLRQGWYYTGQHARYFGGPRGTDPAGIPPARFVIFVQNHDQVGNRALGDRLHHAIPLAPYRAACAVLLCAPQTPLLFMGQEWGASAPFQFFTDHAGELGEQVRTGRAREFERFPSFAGVAAQGGVPDPQAHETFARSRLDWSERESAPHAHLLRLHRDLIRLRRTDPALATAASGGSEAFAVGSDTLVVLRRATDGSELALVARLRGTGGITVPPIGPPGAPPWAVLLDTERASYAPDPQPIEVAPDGESLRITFARPGAVVLRRRHDGGRTAP